MDNFIQLPLSENTLHPFIELTLTYSLNFSRDTIHKLSEDSRIRETAVEPF